MVSAAGSDATAATGVPSWLLRAKVLAPEPPAGYVRREPLLQRIEGVLQRKLTVLRAPAGFGKTTVLADVARDARDRGLIVGWISLDGDDTPNLFGSYLAAAFEHAALDLRLLNTHDAWSSSPAVQQMGMLARAVEFHAAPCLLVLDEVDRLPRRTVQLVDLLVKRAPGNLHVAMAFRSDPGLEVAPHVLAGEAVVAGPEDLRFSRADIARFFRGELSRRELVAVEERTAGWPVALMAYRNLRGRGAARQDADADRFNENYVGVCLLRDLSAEDRAHLLDLAVFDWIDPELVQEVLGSRDALMRVARLAALDGLLLPVGQDRAVRRLHPLVRDYCVGLLSAGDPARKRSLHSRLAIALARRDHLTPAWRHATDAGDSGLVGELIERFGAFELWLRKGVTLAISAGRFLTPEILASRPRLQLLQSMILRLSSRFDEANALFDAVARKTEGFTEDRDGAASVSGLAVDRFFVKGVLAGGADGLQPEELDSRLPPERGAADAQEAAPVVACARPVLLCFVCYERARFEESRRHGLRALSNLGKDAQFGEVFVDVCLGASAMAQGRVQEAVDWYGRARQRARRSFSSDPCLTVSTDVLAIELDLERNLEKPIRQRTLHSLTEVRGVWSEAYAAAVAVSAELTFAQHQRDAVVPFLTRAVDEVRATGIESLSHHVSALLAYYLAELGHAEEGERVWRDGGLARDADGLLDLDRQSWRTMEALSCARTRLLVGLGELAAAEELANRLCAIASESHLTRTLLRGLALSMVVAQGAQQPDQAMGRLVQFSSTDARRGLRAAAGAASRGQPDPSETTARDGYQRRPAKPGRGDADPVGEALNGCGTGLLGTRDGGVGRPPPRSAEQGDRDAPPDDRRRCSLSPEKHLPQGRLQQETRRGALCKVAGYPVSDVTVLSSWRRSTFVRHGEPLARGPASGAGQPMRSRVGKRGGVLLALVARSSSTRLRGISCSSASREHALEARCRRSSSFPPRGFPTCSVPYGVLAGLGRLAGSASLHGPEIPRRCGSSGGRPTARKA